MPSLPDPRPASSLPADHPLASVVAMLCDPAWAGDRVRGHAGAARAVARLLLRGEDEAVTSALAGVPPGAPSRALAAAVDAAINGVVGEDIDAPLLARVFLLPVLLVTAGRAPVTVRGVVPEMAAITRLMKNAGALGPVESFGLSNALADLQAAADIAPGRLFRTVRSLGEAAGADLLPPGDLQVDSAEECVHLRFLAGASVTPAAMPTFLETAGQVGRWGMAVSQELARQLGEEGLSLLALPRAPRPWYAALAEGAFHAGELRFNLFASAAIRRLRGEHGEPWAEVSAREDGSVRVDLFSPLEPEARHAHAWPLARTDDVATVEASIRDLLADCRIATVDVRPEVLPAEPLPAPGAFNLLRH
jgi:hypothetical protein